MPRTSPEETPRHCAGVRSPSSRSGWRFPGLRLLLAAALLGLVSLEARADEAALRTFDVCWSRIKGGFYDRDLHGLDWQEVRERYRPLAAAAVGVDETTEVLTAMIAELEASHCTILDGDVYEAMLSELAGRRSRTCGVMLEEAREGELFVRALYEGGPGEDAGLKLGDRVIWVDGEEPLESDRVVDAGYDPALPGLDLFFLDAQGDGLSLRVESGPDGQDARFVRVVPREMSSLDAAKASMTVFRVGGKRIGRVHAWFCSRGIDTLIHSALRGPFADCDAVIVDLRGRGGYSDIADKIAGLFRERPGRRGTVRHPAWTKPVVFLIDERTRSAKELLSYQIRKHGIGKLVGERTEGAVLGAGFYPLPNGTVLELAIMDVPVDGVRLEGVGVEPDVRQPFDYVYANGQDPILRRGLWVALEEIRQLEGASREQAP